jgi:phosphatidylserine/phosphatidylglycerophosphate/cardiolipin synthase-like enzyme
MTPQEIDAWLAATLEDRRLSRNERQSLRALAASLELGADRDEVAHRAFEVARAALGNPEDRAVIDWLEEVARTLRSGEPDETATGRGFAEAHFSPGEGCLRAIRRHLANAKRTADVCVFTITDDRLAEALIDAHGRGVALRVITDDLKADDLGSDVDRIAGAGIAVRVDKSPFHMHHKFAVLDGATLLTGSYNWTRSAAAENLENLVVSDDVRLVSPFVATFERLWAKLG